jgi:hypothetical protein
VRPAPDDRVPVGAIAVAAACIVTLDHEALGHGSACLAFGGRIALLTSVYFRCTTPSVWIAAAGPAGNLVMSAAAWGALQIVPPRLSRLRWLLLLVAALSVFWEAGYLLYATVLGEGDWAIAARAALGTSPWRWRPVSAALGCLLYDVGMRMTTGSLRSAVSNDQLSDRTHIRALLRTSWAAASLSACVAAAAYAPDRLGAIRQASLEIGAASLPLLILAARIRPGPPRAKEARRDGLGWIIFAAIVYVAFAATLGRGIC